MSNPLEDFLTDYGPAPETKEANFAGDFGKAMIGGLGAGAATAVIGGAAVGAKHLFQAGTKAKSFRQMLSHNEDLAAHHEQDPRRFNQLYSSLHSMNPDFARDPIVAGTYMRRMVENPLTAGGVLAETVGHRAAFPSMIDRSADEAISVSRSHLGRKNSGGNDGPGGR